MSNRLFALALSVGLIVIMAFATPSQATSTTVVASVERNLPASPATLTELVMTDSGVSSRSNLTNSDILPTATATFTPSGPALTPSFSPDISEVNGVAERETFVVPAPFATADTTSAITRIDPVTGAGAHMAPSSDGISFGPLDRVPEPSAMSLLGIGMASLYVFRRYFRRAAKPDSRSSKIGPGGDASNP